ncbi:hypothetical protein BDV32DRAFT_44808 [Aspergillus pseudonomiae]|nr:hypothetical protein BDV32DRAFT_44808 [Aspergillus pseudonomiae]
MMDSHHIYTTSTIKGHLVDYTPLLRTNPCFGVTRPLLTRKSKCSWGFKDF